MSVFAIDLRSKPVDWFLYEGNTGIQWVKGLCMCHVKGTLMQI